MGLVLGCTTGPDCECDPCCCNSSPNCGEERGDDLRFFESKNCCYGPWDIYTRSEGVWLKKHTIYCLTDVVIFFTAGIGKTYKEYRVVFSGKPVDWDPIMDPNTPECWFEIDPYI
jgi:hypothetical protein